MNAVHNRNVLKRSSPEAQGISSSAILSFVEAADRDIDSLHSLMLLRHGKVVAEGWWAPYAPDIPHMLFSLSKSFTSSAIGLAIAEGLLTVDDYVLSFFPDEAPAEVSENLAAMRVRHLLSMSTGQAEDVLDRMEEPNWAKIFLARPVPYEPGTHFLYNSTASYMLSAIIQKLTGETLLEYLTPRLLEPIGIRGATWETCPRGINTGGWGMNIKTEDIARFGQMYLQKGTWHTKRILPEAWIAEATAYHSDNRGNATNENVDWQQGYGYQFWRCQHNAYRGDGAFGQYCVVMPDQDAVLAITAGVENMQSVLDLVWQILLPAMQADALPEDAATEQRLRDKLASLAMKPQTGQALSPMQDKVSGRRYTFDANEQGIESIAFDFDGQGCLCTVRDQAGEHHIRCGQGVWVTGTTAVETGNLRPVAASYAWTADDTLALKLCFYETPFVPVITCGFTDEGAIYKFLPNVAFGPKERPQLEGRVD